MKVFFTAKNFKGEVKSGEAEVIGERELAASMRAEGYVLTSFHETKKDRVSDIKVKFLNKSIGISLTDKLMFTRNLSVMISSGLPLSRAIKNISLQTKKKKFAQILEEIYSDIQSGNSFADALSKYPAIFDDLFVNMIRVGESSGNLEEVLDILAIQIEKEHDLISKVKGAMTYPAVILVVMVGIGVLMLTYILPKLTGVFGGMDVDLPASTRAVIAISDVLRNNGFLVGASLVFLVIFLKYFSRTRLGKIFFSFLLINIPVVGNMTVKVNCSRFARIYSSLLGSGVSALESLRIISDTLTNYYYREALKESTALIQKGVPLSDIISKYPKIFPVLVSQMIQVGEETGKTEIVLSKLADFYENEVNRLSKNMSSVIEPVLMVIIGSAVGFFAVSMLQPMYSIMNNIK